MPSSLIHILIAFLVLLGLIFLSAAGLLNSVLDFGRVSVHVSSYPLIKALATVKNSLLLVFRLSHLAQENQILTRQVEQLSAQLAVLEKASSENKILREALKFQSESKFNLVPAEIITYDPVRVDRKIILNRGKRHGVAGGEAVIVSGGILVGAVSEVYEHTSALKLITSSEFAVNAQTAEGQARGVVKGEHGLGLLFDLVSQNEVMKTGDRVITSGLGGTFPKNLLIGVVGDVRSGSGELFQKASIIPAANLRNLRIVFVIQK